MVRELTRERTEDFQTACAYERVFGSEILTLLRVYGLEDDQVRFYLEEQEGRPAAAIALQDRALWVSVRPGTGVEDLAVLAQSIDGLLEVNGDLAIAQALQPIRQQRLHGVPGGDAAGRPGGAAGHPGGGL